MANNPNDFKHPGDPMIATLWSQLLALDAARTVARGHGGTDTGEHEFALRLRTVALLIASIPARGWPDVLPKVSILSMLRAEGECEPSHTIAMIEAAVARDHDRLQPTADGPTGAR